MGTAGEALGPLADDAAAAALPSVQDRALAALAKGAVAQARGDGGAAKAAFTESLTLAHGQMEGRQAVALSLVPIGFAFLRLEGDAARAEEMCGGGATPTPTLPLPPGISAIPARSALSCVCCVRVLRATGRRPFQPSVSSEEGVPHALRAHASRD